MLLIVSVQFWAMRDVSWYASFTKKTERHMLTPKIGKYRGSLGSLGEPVRPVVETGQTSLGKVVKMPIGLHHCIDLIETIEMHM